MLLLRSLRFWTSSYVLLDLIDTRFHCFLFFLFEVQNFCGSDVLNPYFGRGLDELLDKHVKVIEYVMFEWIGLCLLMSNQSLLLLYEHQ